MPDDKRLSPCPFCGHSPDFVRLGNRRQSCIVECGNCGCRLESSEEDDACGGLWNTRAAPVAPPAQPADGWVMVPRVLTDDMVRAWASSEADMRPSLPEIPEWVRLDKDSEEAWWRWSKEQAARDWADFLAAAPAAPAAQPEGWIACAERMPAVHTLGLVSNADGSRMTVAESWYGGRWRTSAHLASEEVTYWRPLPPAPKREGGA